MNEKVLQCVYGAIDEANEDRDGRPPLEKAPETEIHGSANGLDSLGLINFVVAVEEGVERDFGTALVLSDDRSLSQEPSPFKSVATLTEYIELLLAEQR